MNPIRAGGRVGHYSQAKNKRRIKALSKTLSVTFLILVTVAIPLALTSKISSGTTLSVSEDYQLWVEPYLSQLEKVREVLMTPYTIGPQHYGYDSVTGLVRGGNIEPSPAIGVSGGYQDVIVAIDNNLEGSASLDFFNSASSPLNGQPGFSPVSTNIYGNVRALLNGTWIGVGACSPPFVEYSYPSSFSLLDRREAEYGSFDPYYSTLIKPGNHLGGIGNNCGTEGQTWFLPPYDSLPTSSTQPLIATEFPSSTPIGSTGDLEELSFYIDEMYLQCRAGTSPCSLWQNAYLNAMSQYPFAAPREALHFIQASRATAAWTMSNMTYNGMSAYQMLQDTINQIWSSAVGPDGGLYQSFSGGSSDRTPEPNFQAMIAFDPRMPSWFGQDTGYPSTTSSSSSSSTTTTQSLSSSSTVTQTSATTTSSSSKQSNTSTYSISSSTTSRTETTTTATSSLSSTSSSSTETESTLESGSTTTVTQKVYATIIADSTTTLTETGPVVYVPSTVENATTSFVTVTASPSLDSITTSSPQKELTSTSSESSFETTSTSSNSRPTIPAINSQTQNSSSASLQVPPKTPSAAVIAGPKQNGAKATVLGGFTAFETLILGLIPVYSIWNRSRLLPGKRSGRIWQW